MISKDRSIAMIIGSVAEHLEQDGCEDREEQLGALEYFSSHTHLVANPAIIGMINILLLEAVERGMEVQFFRSSDASPAPGNATVN